MSNKSVEQIPSETALFAALRRTIANKEYKNDKLGPDYLAEYFLPAHYRFFIRFEKIRKNTKEKLDAFMPGMTEYIIARTAYFDRLFITALNDKIPQIVILGAGYDSRAHRYEKNNLNTIVYELDIVPTQNRKKKCLKAARIHIPKFVKYVPIKFIEESIGEVLQKAGYNNREKTLFLWEGVSFYLDSKSVNETLEFVSHSLHRDSAIAFDYTITITEKNIKKYYGSTEFMKTMKEHHANEELMFSIGEGEIESFLGQRDLKVVEHLDNEAIERTYLLDDKGSLIGRITGNFRFVLASLLIK